jgi:hypothetical protein
MRSSWAISVVWSSDLLFCDDPFACSSSLLNYVFGHSTIGHALLSLIGCPKSSLPPILTIFSMLRLATLEATIGHILPDSSGGPWAHTECLSDLLIQVRSF